MTDEVFNPDVALTSMNEFLIGQRTLQGYARFADVARQLANHIGTGGSLPHRWAQVQTVTINLWTPHGLASEHQVGVSENYRTAIEPGSNWMIVRPGQLSGDDDKPADPTGDDATALRELVVDLLTDMGEWMAAEEYGGPSPKLYAGYRARALRLGVEVPE